MVFPHLGTPLATERCRDRHVVPVSGAAQRRADHGFLDSAIWEDDLAAVHGDHAAVVQDAQTEPVVDLDSAGHVLDALKLSFRVVFHGFLCLFFCGELDAELGQFLGQLQPVCQQGDGHLIGFDPGLSVVVLVQGDLCGIGGVLGIGPVGEPEYLRGERGADNRLHELRFTFFLLEHLLVVGERVPFFLGVDSEPLWHKTIPWVARGYGLWDRVHDGVGGQGCDFLDVHAAQHDG